MNEVARTVARPDGTVAIPLVSRWPALGAVARVSLGDFPSPLERFIVDGTPTDALWLKRDDLNAPAFGGNKVRALEFLLASVAPGDVVLTYGGAGSTHVLTTAYFAAQRGARTVAIQWPHDMHPLAERVRARADADCAVIVHAGGAVRGLVRGGLMFSDAVIRRIAGAKTTARVHRVPIGGSSPLGALGHVNAALELLSQVARGLAPMPSRVVVALGSGGTAAGLAAGFALAGAAVQVVGVRVAPRVGTNAFRTRWLARRTISLTARFARIAKPALPSSAIRVEHSAYGGAYGRPLAEGDAAAATFARAGIVLDATYSAKAGAVALQLARSEPGTTLFWLTFDGRWLAGEPERRSE